MISKLLFDVSAYLFNISLFYLLSNVSVAIQEANS